MGEGRRSQCGSPGGKVEPGLMCVHVCNGCVDVCQARLRGELGALGGEDVFLTHAIQQLQVTTAHTYTVCIAYTCPFAEAVTQT